MTDLTSKIRNFCIIAHIDHGKSTLADRFLELTGTVEERKMKDQLLDTMDLEQERGITIKLQPVRMKYKFKDKVPNDNSPSLIRKGLGGGSEEYILNLIDTPGHVDFNYEVSRTLAAVEGAILLVDAVKGIQAQTLSNLYLALEQDLTIIPAINKIDLPNARVKEVEAEIKELLGKDIEVYKISAKEGKGVEELLREVVKQVPSRSPLAPLRKGGTVSAVHENQNVETSLPLSKGEKGGSKIEEDLFDKNFLKQRGLIYNGHHLPYNPDNVEKAKLLRKNMTVAEKKLWGFLKNFRYRILRQRPIDVYIADFYCAELRLVIEIDGEQHYTSEGKEYDKERDNILKGYGITILRFKNEEVLNNFERVCKDIEKSSLTLLKKEGTDKDVSTERNTIFNSPLTKGGQGGLKALIFDSFYDDYKGVIAAVRIFSGEIKKGDKIGFGKVSDIVEAKDVGYFKPWLKSSGKLSDGEIGYIVTGLKDLNKVKVGDTIYLADKKPEKMLPGFKEPKPVVFASIFPQEGENYDELKEALEILNLSDSSLEIKTEFSTILGRGFRLGVLGRLHLEIVKERLKRDSKIEIVVTQPSVAYEVTKTNNEIDIVRRAGEMPEKELIKEIKEPWAKVEIVTPLKYKGEIFTLLNTLRAEFINETMIGHDRINMEVKMPLAELLTSFHDNLKSVSSGYASFSYEIAEKRPANLVRLDILIAGDKVEAFSKIVLNEDVHKEGKKLVDRLKDLIPRQSFQVAVQAAVGGKIVARSDIKAYRKDVTAKLYGGDYSRKQKLLTKQKKGKKKMKEMGRIKIPPDVFLKAAMG